MRRSIEKDKRKRIVFSRYEPDRRLLKSVCQNMDLPLSLRLRANLSLASFPKSSSPTQVRRRCILTGRGRFVLAPFNLSRMLLCKLSKKGLLPGLRKSSW